MDVEFGSLRLRLRFILRWEGSFTPIAFCVETGAEWSSFGNKLELSRSAQSVGC